MGRVAGVVLAAGSATRLGGRKQLLPLAGRPLLAHVLAAARRASLDPVLVVLGAGGSEVARQVDLSGFTVVQNPAYLEGQSTSVRAAVAALPVDVDAAVFLLGDQPEVDHEVVARLVARFRDDAAPIIQPRYAEGRGNPVLIARRFFPELLELVGDAGARPLLRRHADLVTVVEAADLHRPDDVDTPEDYERVRQRLEPSTVEDPR